MVIQNAFNSDITDAQFEEVSAMTKSLAGINLHVGKKELVRARLAKRIRLLKLRSVTEYLEYMKNDPTGQELVLMLDALSTNLTYFFREQQHFDYLHEKVIPAIKSSGHRKIRIWSAGCSSGEEPYTIAMQLHESIPDLAGWDIKILATDLSTKVLSMAKRGLYSEKCFRDTPKHIKLKYFDKVQSGNEVLFGAGSSIRKMITFARLNLMGQWPMSGPFDVIFCRNVMIYFENDTRERLINRFYDLIGAGGYLFMGHSESLAGINHSFKYRLPAIYSR